MLDFFLINDDEPTPDTPDGYVHAGGLTLEIYERLQRFEIIDTRFCYFDDFRWSRETIAALQARLDIAFIQSPNNTDYLEFAQLLNIATTAESGLFAVAD